MHITERKELKRVTNLTKIDLTEKFLKFLDLLPDKLSSSQINTIAIFAKYNLENEDINLLERFNSIQLLGRDSSSVNSLILRYGEKQGNILFQQKNAKCKQTIEKYRTKYGDIVGEEKYKELCVKRSHSIDGYIARYGNHLGNEKFIEFWKNSNFSCSLEAFIRRHGEEEGKKKYHDYCKQCSLRSSGKLCKDYSKWKLSLVKRSISLKNNKYDRDNTSLESFVNRYGMIEGNDKYNTYRQKYKKSNPLCIEYYIERGIAEKGAIELIRTKSLDLCSHVRGRASKESLKIFIKCYKYLRRNGFSLSDIFWGISGSKEYFIRNNSIIKFYDFCVPKLKVIIEYNGSYYHPRKVDIDNNNTNFVNCKNVEEVFNLYNKDQEKIKLAENSGYKVLQLWSVDGLENNIKNSMEFLKENLHHGKVENSQH